MGGRFALMPSLASALVLGIALTVGAAAAAIAARYVYIPPPLSFKFGGAVTPKTLTKDEMAPVAVQIRGKIFAADGTQPPALREAVIDFDKDGAINANGLPVCKASQLEADGAKAAKGECRKAIVGTGLRM